MDKGLIMKFNVEILLAQYNKEFFDSEPEEIIIEDDELDELDAEEEVEERMENMYHNNQIEVEYGDPEFLDQEIEWSDMEIILLNGKVLIEFPDMLIDESKLKEGETIQNKFIVLGGTDNGIEGWEAQVDPFMDKVTEYNVFDLEFLIGKIGSLIKTHPAVRDLGQYTAKDITEKDVIEEDKFTQNLFNIDTGE